ncbi:hypothetical protein JYT36_00645 [Bacteroidales bacterium AH-315-N07]|nr:hypothetical protein [Bacteroidales bacterium AH-315-N07]
MRTKKSITSAVLGLLLIVLVPSCEKPPGEGGTSAIKGKIFIKNYNRDGDLVGEYYGPDERVYIIYGDEDIYGDDMRTHYDGSYMFKNLRKGKYTIYTYSDANNDPSGKLAVKITAEITKNKQIVELEDLTIYK